MAAGPGSRGHRCPGDPGSGLGRVPPGRAARGAAALDLAPNGAAGGEEEGEGSPWHGARAACSGSRAGRAARGRQEGEVRQPLEINLTPRSNSFKKKFATTETQKGQQNEHHLEKEQEIAAVQ